MIDFSRFTGARDNRPEPASLGWLDFATGLMVHGFRPVGDKLECPAFSPAAFGPGATRKNANVEALSMFVADLDAVSEEQAAHFVERVTALGWACVVHSTWSHASKPGTSMRAVLPLSRPVEPEEWPAVWEAINAATGGLSDRACKDPARLYFGAFAPDTLEDRLAAFSHLFEGEPVDVDALDAAPEVALPGPAAPTGGEPIGIERIERFGAMLRRRRDDHAQEQGALLGRVVDGKSFAEPGNVDNTIFRLACTLADRFPTGNPQSIAAHFDKSLEAMAQAAPDYRMTPEQVADKITRAQAAIAAERAEENAEENAAQAARIRDAFGSDRETPYTEAEIEGFPAHRWIIQKGRSYYTLVAGAYKGPYTQDEAQSAAVRDLSPATTAGVELYTLTLQGERLIKPLGRLVREYGFVANDVAVSMVAQTAYFDEGPRTLVEAPLPLRDIEPRFDAEIDGWIDALAGPKARLLRAWLANVTRLEAPCTALFLTGHKSVGKSLMPEGLSRLWSALGFPTPLEDVLGTSFNDAQMRCPLVFADERLPTDHRGRVLNAELRHYIQARRRPLRRKFMPNAEMIGAVRLIISANNEEILSTTENLSNHDIGAIVDRYLHIPCQTAAFEYLQAVDPSDWVLGDKIAAHALWIRDNFEWEPNGRFLVHADDNELHARLISSSGVRSSVLQFCVGYLLDPGLLDSNARGAFWIRVNAGRLCVNAQALLRCWSTYVSNERCPPTGRIAQALAAMSTDARPRLRLPNGKRPNYREIRTEHLIAWAEAKGFATSEEIVAALASDTEERSKHLAPN